jgi:hypothetical protein
LQVTFCLTFVVIGRFADAIQAFEKLFNSAIALEDFKIGFVENVRNV